MNVATMAAGARELSLAFKNTAVLDKLDQCKVITVKDLFKWSDYQKSYEGFRRLIFRMEKNNILSSFIHQGSKEKYVFINEKIAKIIPQDSGAKVNKDTLIHDAIVSKVMLGLYHSNFIDYFALEHNFESIQSFFKNFDSIIPDSIGFSNISNFSKQFSKKFKISKNSNLKFVFEIELNQKSRNRVFEKLEAYTKHDEVDQVFYFFVSENIYESYKLRLNEIYNLIDDNVMKAQFADKISLVYCDTLLWGQFSQERCAEYNINQKKFF